MRVRTHGIALASLFAFALSVPAMAAESTKGSTEYPVCTRQVSEAESNAAHAKYLSGKVDYDEGKYESAIENFRAAYEKDCTKHELLIIISRAYEISNNEAEAIRALETYLERVPNAPDAAIHKKRIANMKERLAAQQKQAAAAASTATPAPSSSNDNGGAQTPPPGGEAQSHTVYPWLVVGLGAIGVGIGVVFLVIAPSIPKNCDANTGQCTQPTSGPPRDLDADKTQAENSKNFPVIGGVTAGIGGALIVGGVIWHFLEPTGPATSGAGKLVPAIGAGYAGLGYTGRF